jgi:hypothetical protein
MASLSIAASAPGWESSITAMRAMPRNIKSEVSRRGRDLAEPLAVELRAAGHAQGSHANRVADHVKSGMRAGMPTVTAKGLPYIMGSEYGGGHRRTTYFSTSPRGKQYVVVRRATTRQFAPYVGKTGKWWNPTIFEGDGSTAVLEAWADLVEDVIRKMT